MISSLKLNSTPALAAVNLILMSCSLSPLGWRRSFAFISNIVCWKGMSTPTQHQLYKQVWLRLNTVYPQTAVVDHCRQPYQTPGHNTGGAGPGPLVVIRCEEKVPILVVVL